MSPLSPADYRKTEYTHRIGLRADQPAANTVLEGTIYFVTDEVLVERSDGSNWVTFSLSDPWTPAFISSGGNSGQTYQTYNTASSIRIGNQVTIGGRCALATLGTFGAGTIYIGTLPLGSVYQVSATIGYFAGLAAAVSTVKGLVDGNYIHLSSVAAAGAVNSALLPDTQMTGLTDIVFAATFETF